jgi:uncharacterized protein
MPDTGLESGTVMFSGDDRLQGILDWPEDGPAAAGVVVAHPHPLYGGTMGQPVVYRIAQACRAEGLATLRFNFRGVGRSRGRYSGSEEYRDVEAAAAYLRGRMAVKQGDADAGGRLLPLALAGYSFGSVMAATAAAGAVPVQALALVAFVVDQDVMPSAALGALAWFRGPVLAVCGEDDDLAPPDEVEKALGKLDLDYTVGVIAGAGHLFEGEEREVGRRVAAFLRDALTRERAAL